MTDIKQQVGTLIRDARKQRGLTQKEMGERLGISEGSYNRYENGKANLSLDTIDKVAQVIGIQIKVMAG